MILPSPPLYYDPVFMFDLTSLVVNNAEKSVKVDEDNPIYTGALIFKSKGLAVTEVNITNAGTGYSNSTVTFTGGGASTQATGTVTLSGGSVQSISVDTPGFNYTSAPTVTIGGDGASATATAVVDHRFFKLIVNSDGTLGAEEVTTINGVPVSSGNPDA